MTIKHGGGTSNTPQVDLLYDHLVNNKTITPLEAQELYQVRSFHRRMADLVKLGVKLGKTSKRDNTGRRYVEYRFMGVTI